MQQGPPSSGRNLRSASHRLRSRPIVIDDEDDDELLEDIQDGSGADEDGSEDSSENGSGDHAPTKVVIALRVATTTRDQALRHHAQRKRGGLSTRHASVRACGVLHNSHTRSMMRASHRPSAGTWTLLNAASRCGILATLAWLRERKKKKSIVVACRSTAPVAPPSPRAITCTDCVCFHSTPYPPQRYPIRTRRPMHLLEGGLADSDMEAGGRDARYAGRDRESRHRARVRVCMGGSAVWGSAVWGSTLVSTCAMACARVACQYRGDWRSRAPLSHASPLPVTCLI